MRRIASLACFAVTVGVIAGCAGSSDAGLLQDGPMLRTIAADGTLVVEGRAFNLSDRPVEGAQVQLTIRSGDRQPLVLTVPLGEAGHVGAFETVEFRIETQAQVTPTAQMSIGFSGADAP